MSKKEIKETTLYHFHRSTGEYSHTTIARLDPKEGKPLIPAYSTIVPLPEQKIKENQRYVFREGAWVTVDDYRGQAFYEKDGTKIIIQELDITPDKKWSKDVPPPPPEELKQSIKVHAAQRIADSGHDWMALRQVTTEKPVPKKVIKYAAAVRAASNDLEEILPLDYTEDKHWPERI